MSSEHHCYKHGNAIRGKTTRTYQTWADMVKRCTNPNCNNWTNYGGRGIKVCERWRKFEHFLEDMGDKPPGTTIDRINNEGDYEKANCRWASMKHNMRNTRRSKFVLVDGVLRNVSELSETLGIHRSTLDKRLKNLSVEESLSRPVAHRPNLLLITFRKQRHDLETWADILGLNKRTLRSRLGRGWTMKRIASQPIRARG